MTRIWRADRNLSVRLGVAAAAMVILGVPVLWLAMSVRDNWTPLVDLDTTVATELNAVALRHDRLVHLMEAVSFVLGPWVLRPVVTVMAVVLLVRRRPRLGCWVLVTLWVGALLGVVLKELVDRARPELAEAVATAGGRSFPSGHALGATIAVGLLALVLGALLSRRGRVVLWLGAAAAVLLVSFSRVLLGVHYLSDVTAGIVVGVAWLVITASAFHAWRRDVGLPPAPAEELEPELGDGVPEPH